MGADTRKTLTPVIMAAMERCCPRGEDERVYRFADAIMYTAPLEGTESGMYVYMQTVAGKVESYRTAVSTRASIDASAPTRKQILSPDQNPAYALFEKDYAAASAVE